MNDTKYIFDQTGIGMGAFYAYDPEILNWTLTYSVDCFALSLIFILFHMWNVASNLLLVYMTEEKLTHFSNYNEQILEGMK